MEAINFNLSLLNLQSWTINSQFPIFDGAILAKGLFDEYFVIVRVIMLNSYLNNQMLAAFTWVMVLKE